MADGMFAQTKEIRGQRMNAVLICLRRHPDRAVPAIELAEAAQVLGHHETKRRAVRKVIARLHDDGHRICADSHPADGGYWIARNAEEWRRYRESRRSGARFAFVRDRRMHEAVVDRVSGQRKLF